jgi:hypothetical protein
MTTTNAHAIEASNADAIDEELDQLAARCSPDAPMIEKPRPRVSP